MGKQLGPDKVTARQRACYEMRRSGSTWEEIGLALGMSPDTARGHVRSAERHGLPRLAKQLPGISKTGKPDPEAAIRLAGDLGAVSAETGEFNLRVFTEMATAAGIPARLASALGKRIQMNFGAVTREMKSQTIAEQVAATQQKAQLVLEHIDEVSLAGMNAKDLAMAYGILTDKALLLGGKPTQIVDFNVRRQLTVRMPQMLAEARRRGLTIDGVAKIIHDDDDAHASST